ncbi:hypothetical protein QTP86_018652 [Hemibagrus guttatus]|nr:hypothetical protein QTP86_018652 [Hemibagrus guttatus]
MKLWERVVEARLRKVVEICEQQYGFMPRKSTTDAIFALRILMEKYRDGQRELHCVFVDLEKAYDRVPREELWYCMRKSGVAEKYVRVVQDMYERSRTVVRCAVGQTEEFKVEVGLHQGSALSPFMFAIVIDQLSEEVRQESPWTMMFADDIVICSESREQVEENLERWRFALERRGMKVSRSKTEYMCVNEREGSGTVRLQGEEMKKVQEFKYLGSTVQSNGECGKEVKKRVQAGWNGWRKVWGVLCERKISARIKGKVYRTVVRPAMLYGLETVSLRKRQESKLEVAELKMLRFSLGGTRLYRIRNEYIRGTAHVGRLGDKVREARLRWFGHVQRRESEYIGRRMLDMELPGRRALCCKGPPPPRPEYDVVCIGLTGSGKTSLLSRLCNEAADTIVPTTGFSIKAVPFQNAILNVKELGGAWSMEAWRCRMDRACHELLPSAVYAGTRRDGELGLWCDQRTPPHFRRRRMDPIRPSSSSSPGLAPPRSSSAEEIAGHTFGGFRPSRAEVVAHLDCASGDVARCCCSPVDVVRFCCSAVDVARPPVRRWMSLDASAQLWTSFGTLRPYRRAESIKKYWSRYYQGSQGVVFVLDSASSDEDLEMARTELHSALQHPQLCTLPFLILANQQDKPAARSIHEVKKYFELEPLARGKSWLLEGSTVENMDAVKESFSQLIHLLEEKDLETGRI